KWHIPEVINIRFYACIRPFVRIVHRSGIRGELKEVGPVNMREFSDFLQSEVDLCIHLIYAHVYETRGNLTDQTINCSVMLCSLEEASVLNGDRGLTRQIGEKFQFCL